MNNVCNICGSPANKIFDALVLNKYQVDYFQCTKCGFIQTEKPYWLPEAYNSAMTALDVGLVYRNTVFSRMIPPILNMFSQSEDAYLDYGGGYGLFVRMMRDQGFNFYLQDLYAENLYARHFELKDYTAGKKFAALTAFEVFEHLDNPQQEITRMLELSDTLIFSTELQPSGALTTPESWWYFVPEVGQHVSFYNLRSLEMLAAKFDCTVYSNGSNLHILTKKKIERNPFDPLPQVVPGIAIRILQKILRRLQPQQAQTKVQERKSLLEADFELYKSFLQKSFK